MLRAIALLQQIPVSLQGVLRGSGKPGLRSQPVGGAEYIHTALDRKRGSEALGIFQVAAGVAAAVEVENHALAANILRQNPGPFKSGEIMDPDHHLAAVLRFHHLADFILALSDSFQLAAAEQRHQQSHLGPYCFDSQCHSTRFLHF